VLSDLELVEIQILSKRDVGLEEIKHHLGRGIEVCIESHKQLLMRGQDILAEGFVEPTLEERNRESSIKGSAPLVAKCPFSILRTQDSGRPSKLSKPCK
jgi:hypothetical protein